MPALLETQRPDLFQAYKKMISGRGERDLPVISDSSRSKVQLSPVLYLNTDIYIASRQIKKMQKLHSNILTTWPDNLPKGKLIKRK